MTGLNECKAEAFRDNYNKICPNLNIEKGNRIEIMPHEKYINEMCSTRQIVFIESGKTIFKDPHCYHTGRNGEIIEKLNEYDISRLNEFCRNHEKSYLIDRVGEAFKMSIGKDRNISKTQNISF